MLALGLFTAGAAVFTAWIMLMLNESSIAFLRPVCLAVSLALILASIIVFIVYIVRRRTGARHVLRSVAQESDAKLLVEVRENAGWLKACLIGSALGKEERLECSRRMKRMKDLQGSLSYRLRIPSAIEGFHLAVHGCLMSGSRSDDSKKFVEAQQQLLAAHRRLMNEIQRII